MSSTFATKSGSLEILKLRTRCGLRPCSAQMRCTLVWLMPISSAIDRTLQCVALAGRSFTVFSTTLSFMAALSGFSARRLGAAFDQTIDAGLGKIVLPAPDGGLRNPDLTHNRHDAMTVRRHQHDPRSLGDLLSRVSIGDQLLQFPASLAIKYNQVVSHAASESYSRQVGIQMSVTEH